MTQNNQGELELIIDNKRIKFQKKDELDNKLIFAKNICSLKS